MGEKGNVESHSRTSLLRVEGVRYRSTNEANAAFHPSWVDK